jgi:hypothetical protein
VLGKEPTCKGVSRRNAVRGEGAEAAERSRDIRVVAGECLKSAYSVPC